jgi:hypothetical protein
VRITWRLKSWMIEKEQDMMKPWQTPLNKAPNKRGKEGTKREDLSKSQKRKSQGGSLMGKGTNHVPR